MKNWFAVLCCCVAGALYAEDVTIAFELPPPYSSGTPKEIKSDNLEPDPGPGKRRAPITVPAGYEKKLTSDKTGVTGSVESEDDLAAGEYAFIVDGDKTADDTCMLKMPGGLQWVQLDLGATHEISAVCVWHDQGDDRAYRDVIVQVSDDAAFVDGVQTVFNNDHDGSAKLGKGTEKEYRERNEGRPMAAKHGDAFPKGRYVRCYSNGSSSEPLNNYIEVEVYGK